MYRFSNSLPYLLDPARRADGRSVCPRRPSREGLTLPMYRVLAALAEQGQSAAARRNRRADLGRHVSTLSRIVAEMSRAGLLTRDRPENDQRSLQVALTPKGAELAGRLMPIAAILRRGRYRRDVGEGRRRAQAVAGRALREPRSSSEHEVEAGTDRGAAPRKRPPRSARGIIAEGPDAKGTAATPAQSIPRK